LGIADDERRHHERVAGPDDGLLAAVDPLLVTTCPHALAAGDHTTGSRALDGLVQFVLEQLGGTAGRYLLRPDEDCSRCPAWLDPCR